MKSRLHATITLTHFACRTQYSTADALGLAGDRLSKVAFIRRKAVPGRAFFFGFSRQISPLQFTRERNELYRKCARVSWYYFDSTHGSTSAAGARHRPRPLNPLPMLIACVGHSGQRYLYCTATVVRVYAEGNTRWPILASVRSRSVQ